MQYLLLLPDARSPQVGFNAQLTVDRLLGAPSHIKFDNVLYNAGEGYSSATGNFTAPVAAGLYFLAFHAMTNAFYWALSYLKVNGAIKCYADIAKGYGHGACFAVEYLRAGDSAWVEPLGVDRFYTKDTTSFAGFLINADPYDSLCSNLF
jgi:hypothetical protein